MQENEAFYYQCKKELAVIERMNIDSTGTIEELNERIASQSIYFMNPKEYESIIKKAKKYDIIQTFINKE